MKTNYINCDINVLALTGKTYRSTYSSLVSEMLHLNELFSVFETRECCRDAHSFFTSNYNVDFHSVPQICCASLAKTNYEMGLGLGKKHQKCGKFFLLVGESIR